MFESSYFDAKEGGGDLPQVVLHILVLRCRTEISTSSCGSIVQGAVFFQTENYAVTFYDIPIPSLSLL